MENINTNISPDDTICACADYYTELIAATEKRYAIFKQLNHDGLGFL